ncbi:hypothetical protein HPB47_028133 [Ixodes persulcatus]|uniref:Uncharacterized protein n=1 Tax=Ixodes persulcatus TaxID=34615 RepID=A0AC60PUE9_IXOPE|nr:hypothetical protein HPB47_028133 [Ixodes persulcatus]
MFLCLHKQLRVWEALFKYGSTSRQLRTSLKCALDRLAATGPDCHSHALLAVDRSRPPLLLKSRERESPQKVPEDTADFDLSEVKREERAARKARLTTLLPANPHRIPSSFPRWERVALNRLQTKTVLTPVWLSRIYHPTDPDDVGPDPNC